MDTFYFTDTCVIKMVLLSRFKCQYRSGTVRLRVIFGKTQKVEIILFDLDITMGSCFTRINQGKSQCFSRGV